MPIIEAPKTKKKRWRKAQYVTDAQESTIIAEFRCGNSRLGNKDSDMAEYAPENVNANGQIDYCPACNEEDLSEHHIVIDCSSMLWERKHLYVLDETPLQDFIEMNRSHGMTSKLILRQILGGDGSSKQKLFARAKTLESIRIKYFSKWLNIGDS